MHTSGPFSRYIDEDGNAISVTKWIDGPRGGKMAISLAKMPMPNEYLSQEQINANACLFSAAPTMLAALKSIAQRANESGTGDLGLLETIYAMHEIARAAIRLGETGT